MKVEIISREGIKPSSPTPTHRRSFKLSLVDQTNYLAYIPMSLFYPALGSSHDQGKTYQTTKLRSGQLKKSLPETLTRFYPFAGRIKDEFSIDCNDEGVDYIEAKVNSKLSKVLRYPQLEVLDHFLPPDLDTTIEPHKMAQVAIQVTTFDCGGLAIGLRFLHKIIDASSMAVFVKDWANSVANADSTTEAVSLDPIFFIQDSLFPPIHLSNSTFSSPSSTTTQSPKLESISTKTRRFVFDGPNIAALKAKAIMTNNSSSSCVKKKNPTRVQVVSSLLMQRIMAATRSISSSKKFFLSNHAVNMRSRINPPLPENSIGNFSFFTSVFSSIEDKNELHDLMDQLDEAIGKLNDDFIRKLQADDKLIFEDIKNFNESYSREVVYFVFSSYCGFPLYETDFGWGKPEWVTIVSLLGMSVGNLALLMDTGSGDGIEAWVSLDEKVMDVLERDNDFLEFAKANPSVLYMNTDPLFWTHPVMGVFFETLLRANL